MTKNNKLIKTIISSLEKLDIDKKDIFLYQNICLFLIDWKNCIDNGLKVSNFDWFISEEGFPEYKNNTLKNICSSYKHINEKEKKVINYVLSKAQTYTKNKIIHITKSTYPLITQDYGPINIKQKAVEYKLYHLSKEKFIAI